MKCFILAIGVIILCYSCGLVKPIKGKYYEPGPVSFKTESSPDVVWDRFTDFIVDYGLKPQIIDATSGLFFLNDCTFETTIETGKRNIKLLDASAPFVSSSTGTGNKTVPRYDYVKADINLKIKTLVDKQTEVKIYLSNWQVFL